MFLLVVHVLEPLEDQEMVSPADIVGEVPLVVCGETHNVFPVLEFMR